MKKRILTGAAALLCAVTLLTAGVTPALASPVPDGDEGGISARYEEFRWYYRTNHGDAPVVHHPGRLGHRLGSR